MSWESISFFISLVRQGQVYGFASRFPRYQIRVNLHLIDGIEQEQVEVCGIISCSLRLFLCQVEHALGEIAVPGIFHCIFMVVYGTAFPGLLIRFLIFRDFHGVGEDAVRIVTEYPLQLCKADLPEVILRGAELGDDHLHVCRCLENGMDMGAGTILSITIIAWAYLPVNRNTVPVCVICAPIWCHLVIFLWGVFPDSPLECIKRPPRSGVFLDGLYVFSK